MGALICIVVVVILFKVVSRMLSRASKHMEQQTEESQRQAELYRVQTETVAKASRWIANRFDEVQRDGHVPQWLVDDMEQVLISCQLSEFSARQKINDYVRQRGFRVDPFGAVCRVPEELEGAEKTEAMQKMRIWLEENQIPHADRVRAWLYNNPGKTEEDADISFFALEMLAKDDM